MSNGIDLLSKGRFNRSNELLQNHHAHLAAP
jgi:hypothetical protein